MNGAVRTRKGSKIVIIARQVRRLQKSARLLFLMIPTLSAVAACSGSGGTATAPISVTPTSATSSTCFTPSTATQNVALPNTAGFTGTLTVGAFPAAGTSCDVTVTVATGGAVVAPAAIDRAARAVPAGGVRHAAASGAPLLSITLDNAFTNNVAITGAVLNTPANLNFPDGTYYALVSFPLGQPPETLAFTASNGVLTLASTGYIMITSFSTGTLYLYPLGVMPPAIPPTPTPAPTATPSAGATATPTGSACTNDPYPTPAPIPGAYGCPPPPDETVVGSYSWSGQNAFDPNCNNSDCSGGPASANETMGGRFVFGVPNGFYGTITFQWTFQYMGITQVATNCPSDWTVTATTNLAGSIVIPKTDYVGQNQPSGVYQGCNIDYQTLPPGASGLGYDNLGIGPSN